MTLLWPLPMRVISFASAFLLCFSYFLFIKMYANCFSAPFGVLYEACLSGFFFSYMMLSATNFCDISHCFIQSPRMFESLSVCMVQHWDVQYQHQIRAQRWSLRLQFVCFSWISWICRLICKLFRHDGPHIPFVDRDHGCNGTFVDVLNPLDFPSPIHVHKCSNTMFVLEFFQHSCVYMTLFWLPYLSFVWSVCFTYEKSIAFAPFDFSH